MNGTSEYSKEYLEIMKFFHQELAGMPFEDGAAEAEKAAGTGIMTQSRKGIKYDTDNMKEF